MLRKLLRRTFEPFAPLLYGFLIPIPPLDSLKPLNRIRVKSILDDTCRVPGNNVTPPITVTPYPIQTSFWMIIDPLRRFLLQAGIKSGTWPDMDTER